MRVFALWQGGHNYGQGDIEAHLEEFHSLAMAINQFRSRYETGHYVKQSFYYAGKHYRIPYYTLTPNVDETAQMLIWLYDPREVSDPYPDRVISFGNRGGVRVERC